MPCSALACSLDGCPLGCALHIVEKIERTRKEILFDVQQASARQSRQPCHRVYSAPAHSVTYAWSHNVQGHRCMPPTDLTGGSQTGSNTYHPFVCVCVVVVGGGCGTCYARSSRSRRRPRMSKASNNVPPSVSTRGTGLVVMPYSRRRCYTRIYYSHAAAFGTFRFTCGS